MLIRKPSDRISQAADQLKIIIEEVDNELERERKRLEVAAEITKLVGTTLDFDEVAKRALQATITFLSTEKRQAVGTFQRVDPKTKLLWDLAGIGYEAGQENIPVPLGEGVTGRVAQTGKPLLIGDVTDPQWKGVYVDVMAGAMRSELAVPLKREGKVWGVLNVESPVPNDFDENDQRLLETIAEQVMISLRNAEVHRELERERDRLEVAAEITKLVGAILDFDEVAKKALQATARFLSTETRPVDGTLQRLDLETKELMDVAGVGYETGREDIRVPVGKGVTGRVAQTGESLLIGNVTDPQWKGVYVDVMAGAMRSELAIPLKREGKVWGVLNVESPVPNAFDENDQRLLETIADQIMIALDNAEVHRELERERDRLEVAAEITKLVGTTLDFDEVARKALQATARFLSSGTRHVVGTLQRLDLETKELMDVAGVGYETGREDIRVPLGEGVTGRVAETGKPLLIGNVTDAQWKDVYVNVMAGAMRSELVVPLKREGKVWGALNVESLAADAFDENDQRLLETIADQIMIALQNAETHQNLMQEQSRRIALEEWNTLSQATGGLLHHLGNWFGVMRPTLRDIREAVMNHGEAFGKNELKSVNEDLDIVENNVQTALGLLGALQKSFTGEPPQIESVNVNMILNSVLGMKKLKGVEILPELGEGLPDVHADKYRLTEAVAEIFRNAEKALPKDGGRIIVGSRSVQNWVEIWVADNGRGIAKEEQEKIFQLFYRGDREKPGYGLGLASVRSRIASFNGEVLISSEGRDRGTTVTIRLPISPRK